MPVVAAAMSVAASNGLGAMKKKDIVIWRTGELVHAATVGFFVEAKTHDGRAVKAVVHMHKKSGLTVWEAEEKRKMVIDVAPLRAVPYLINGNKLFLRIPCM